MVRAMPEGVNLEMAMNSTDNNVEFLQSLLLGMVEEHEKQAEELQEAQRKGDIAKMK